MKVVFVVGAGPAGLYAAQKIARAGHEVVIFNRDIKPGGLAEYGIYPTKEKMKGGLRKQFAKILALPQVSYFGHLPVGEGYALHLNELREFNPAALVFSVGAQGTKELGLPGEHSKGVYSAKDFVFFYNQLPPFSSQDFSTGKRVAIVGMGNVAIDIAHWLLVDDPHHSAEEVTIVARRGPFEAKFDEKEFDYVAAHLDRRAFDEELRRVKEKVTAVGQDITKLSETTFPILAKPAVDAKKPVLKFRFMCSAKEIIPGPSGRIEKLVVTENILVPKGETTAAKATDQTTTLDFDTMIFAIGDAADPKVGLPFSKDSYITNPDVATNEYAAYEVFDPAAGKVVPGTFVVGWARKASEGLVGVARFDAEKGAGHVLEYLERVSEPKTATPAEIARRIERTGRQLVDKAGIDLLGRVEAAEAQKRGLPSFKFADDEKMLAAIAQERTAPVSADD
ncbi:MAG: FAD-dependent oxidoreductase [Acidobacteria bacterium]|nr:FAD-dependent oxidoreductase [Acidobacteriota bacterium]